MPSPAPATSETAPATPAETPAPGAFSLAAFATELQAAHQAQDGKTEEGATEETPVGEGTPETTGQTAEEGSTEEQADSGEQSEEGDKGKDKPTKDDKATPGITLEAIQALAKDGKVPEILKALGLDPKGAQGIPQARFAELRKHAGEVKKREAEVTAREQELQGLARGLHEEVTAIRSAREALKSGSVQEALRLAFGAEDVDEILTASVEEKTAKDPVAHRKLRELEQKLRAQEKADAERKAKAEQEQAEAEQRKVSEAQAAREVEFCGQLAKLLEKDEPGVVAASNKSGYTGALTRVLMNTMLREYNESGIEISPSEALSRFRAEHQLWTDILGASGRTGENTDQAGLQPENTDRAGSSPARTKQATPPARHTKAAQARPEVNETHEQRIKRFANELARAHVENPRV